MTVGVIIVFSLFGLLFLYKYLHYARHNTNRASYYLSGISLLILMFILYLLAFHSGLKNALPQLTFMLICLFYLAITAAAVFVIRYVTIYLVRFVKEVNRF